MNELNHNQPDPAFPDETPRSIEASQETPMERQEQKLENKEKETQQPEASAGSNRKTITDLEEDRRTGSQEDQARTDGPYGVQEPEAEQ